MKYQNWEKIKVSKSGKEMISKKKGERQLLGRPSVLGFLGSTKIHGSCTDILVLH